MEITRNLKEEFKDLSVEDAEFNKKCAKIAQEINLGQLTIVQLVEQLGGLLVDPAPENRELGTWILTYILEGLPHNHLDRDQLIFICNFYSDRLKDHHRVIPAVLRGFYALAQFEHFPEGASSQFLNTLFKHISCQQQQQKDREQIYKLFDILLENHKSELQSMGFELIYGVITSVDGERDPKNLLFLFNWFPKFLKSFEFKHLTEEAFEVLACYFPVDFKAPPQDPNTITRDKLAEALAPCLCAIPDFAEFCIPLALDKLDSSLDLAKIDSLRLLEIGCNNFEVSSFVQHSTEIWSQIQKELFNYPSIDVENAGYATLRAVIKKISIDPTFNTTLKDIIDTLKGNLIPDSRLYQASSRLLLNIAKASDKAANFTISEVAPILLNTFNITNSPDNKIVVLNDLIGYYLISPDNNSLEGVPILSFKSSLDDVNVGVKATGYNALAQISHYLPLDVRKALYENLRHNLIIFQDSNVRNSLIKCFVELSYNYPEEIKSEVVAKIEVVNSTTLKLFLSALREIAGHEYFTNDAIDFLLKYLLQKDLDIITVALNSARKFLQRHEKHGRILELLDEKRVIEKIAELIQNQGSYLDLAALISASFIIKTIIGHLSSERQRDVIKTELIINRNDFRSFVILLDGFLTRLRRDVCFYNREMVMDLKERMQNCNDKSIRNIADQVIANLINKSEESVLNNYLDIFNNVLNSRSDDDLKSCAWIAKALVMRNHHKANIYIDSLIETLKEDCSDDNNNDAARCFRIIMNDSYDSLSAKSYCNKTLLYRQKFFTIVSNKLCESYNPEYKSYLKAIGYLLEFTPKAAILLQFKKIFKLITLCLEECTEAEVLLIILQIILGFTINREKCIEDNLTDFLSRLLKLSTFEKSMKVRIWALQCLQKFPICFPVYKLLPQKQQVLNILAKCIDDKKRFVRREAVEARSLWFLLDAPI